MRDGDGITGVILALVIALIFGMSVLNTVYPVHHDQQPTTYCITSVANPLLYECKTLEQCKKEAVENLEKDFDGQLAHRETRQ
jgi:hypothetical protein